MPTCRICKQSFESHEALKDHAYETKCGEYAAIDTLQAQGEVEVVPR